MVTRRTTPGNISANLILISVTKKQIYFIAADNLFKQSTTQGSSLSLRIRWILSAKLLEFVLAPLELMVPNDKFTIRPVERLQASMEA